MKYKRRFWPCVVCHFRQILRCTRDDIKRIGQKRFTKQGQGLLIINNHTHAKSDSIYYSFIFTIN